MPTSASIHAPAAYASEASNYRQVPLCVVPPRTIDELVGAVRSANEAQAAVLPRGAGTSMCGQSVNTAVVLDHSMHLNSIVSIDRDRRPRSSSPASSAINSMRQPRSMASHSAPIPPPIADAPSAA
ncbi:FAD-binding oxidoreductase [Pararobbsia alpina]|uniref:FAD-binding oxidoreductase n=1 Tax=Pararobbsia alpina TaxID=621374 RepID=UPI0031B5E400